MLTGILLANGNISASILNSLYNENLVKEGEESRVVPHRGLSAGFVSTVSPLCSGVSAAFAVKLFKSWIHEKDINSVAGSLRKVGMDNRLMVSRLPLVRRQGRFHLPELPPKKSRAPTGALSCQQAELRAFLQVLHRRRAEGAVRLRPQPAVHRCPQGAAEGAAGADGPR